MGSRMTAVRVVIADDHPIWRSGVRADLGDNFTVVGEAGDADEAIEVINEHSPDLVLCDLHMPNGGGLKVAQECGERHPHRDAHRVRGRTRPARRRRGRRGGLPREVHPAGRAAAWPRGRPPTASRCSRPTLAALVLGEFRRMAKQSGGLQPLSDREREVLQYVARGHTYREIGEQLFISQKTVENHVRNILGKLHLNRKQELIRYAVEHGIE